MPASRRGFLLGLGVLAAPATLLAPALRPTAAEPHHDHDLATALPPMAVAFERTMRALWEDHATWTRLFIVSAAADLPDLETTAQRLLRNQADIGDAVKPFFGEEAGDALTALLTDHILGAADLLTAAKAGDPEQIEAATAAWYANGDEIAAFLSAANSDHWPLAEMRAEMRMHLDLTLAEAQARLLGDWEADVAAYDEVHLHILAWADVLSTGLVRQFPERFAYSSSRPGAGPGRARVRRTPMPNYSYLIVGGGMTTDAAVRGIRDVDPDGTIGLIGAEVDPPYKRPPLSKGLWQGKPLEKIWSGTERHGAELHLGRSVRWLDLKARRAVDDRGTAYGFDKLLLATGATPRRLPVGGHQVIHFRTLQDYRRLRALVDDGRRFAVVGGGFIGSEIAAALAANGKEVAMIFPEQAIGARLFPADLARSLNGVYREQGVEVLAGQTVVGIDDRGDGPIVRTRSIDGASEREIAVDGVVAGIGTQPNVDLAQAAGLAVDGGIVVDPVLRTSHPDVFAAGDVAAFCLSALGERRRVEHEDNAKTMGRFAGRAMAGAPAPYDHLPFFYSDLFDLGYEAVGDLDPRLETIVDWKVPYREGVVYYLGDDRVRGVLLWNVWDQVDAARQLIAGPGPVRPEDLVGRLPESH